VIFHNQNQTLYCDSLALRTLFWGSKHCSSSLATILGIFNSVIVLKYINYIFFIKYNVRCFLLALCYNHFEIFQMKLIFCVLSCDWMIILLMWFSSRNQRNFVASWNVKTYIWMLDDFHSTNYKLLDWNFFLVKRHLFCFLSVLINGNKTLQLLCKFSGSISGECLSFVQALVNLCWVWIQHWALLFMLIIIYVNDCIVPWRCDSWPV